MGINNVLPFRLGDVFRITSFNKKLNNIPKEFLVLSLVIEKLFDFSVAFILFFFGALNFKESFSEYKSFIREINISYLSFLLLFFYFN